MEQDDSSISSTPAQASVQVQAMKAAGEEKQEKQGQQARKEKNLYVPYRTPSWAWWLIRSLARLMFLLAGRVEIRGRENVPARGSFILASNHLSWFDVPLVPGFLQRQVFSMAKEELFYSKAGWIARFLGGFPVKRGEGDRQAIRAADTLLKEGDILMMFPEGTRSKTHTLAKGHFGLGMIALRSGVPVVPVAVTGSEKLFKQFRPRVTVTYGPPLTFKPEGRKLTREDIERATNETMEHIATMLPPEYRGAYNVIE